MFIGLVTCCYALLPVVTSLEKKYLVKLVSMLHFYTRFQLTDTLLHMFIGLVTCCYTLLPVVTSLEEKRFVKIDSRFYFYISFQPTRTFLHMFIELVTCCYLLLHLQRRKSLSNYIPGSIFIIVSNARVSCYICSLGWLLVVTSFYIFRKEMFFQTSFLVPFCICFQTLNTLLYMFIGLFTCCYALLPVVTS